MASLPEITVTIERAMHDGLRDLAQKLYDQHGVKLNSANISWYDIGAIGAPRIIVAAIRVDSETTQATNAALTGDGQKS